MLVDPETKRPTRVRIEDNNGTRVARGRAERKAD